MPTSFASPWSLAWLKCLHLLQTLAFFFGSSAYISCKPLISFLAQMPTSFASPWFLAWLQCLHLLQTLAFFFGSSACVSCKPLISFLPQVQPSPAPSPSIRLGSADIHSYSGTDRMYIAGRELAQRSCLPEKSACRLLHMGMSALKHLGLIDISHKLQVHCMVPVLEFLQAS